jgi:hypothetical protein
MKTPKKLFIIIILTVIAAFSSFKVSAQENVNLFKLSPFHFFISTMKIEWEHSTGKKSSVIISPRMTALDQDDEKVLGGGLELGRKFYLPGKDTLKLNGFYAQLSFSYNYFSCEYSKSFKVAHSNYYWDDSTYYIHYKEQIRQAGGDFIFGHQFSFSNTFYVDMYFEVGMRMSVSSRGKDSEYRSSILDFGYSGVVPKTGIKVGLRI